MDQNHIEKLQAEYKALDIMYGNTIRELHVSNSGNILKDEQIKKLVAQVNDLLKEKEELKKSQESAPCAD